MSEKTPNNEEQQKFDFETIHSALCWDGTAPEHKQESRQDLTQVGEGEFVDSRGDIYAPAIRRPVDKEQKYVLREKSDVPEDVRKEIARLKKKFKDRTWTDLYVLAKINLSWTPPPVGTTYQNEDYHFK
jgi:hypothetical protein